jgi:thiamine biosynthesis protein ThiS
MRITLNGQETTLKAPCSVASLLRHIKLDHAACAVEVNRTLVPKRDHGERELADGDAVEVVTLVGGG